jgi:hypothetical protein
MRDIKTKLESKDFVYINDWSVVFKEKPKSKLDETIDKLKKILNEEEFLELIEDKFGHILEAHKMGLM